MSRSSCSVRRALLALWVLGLLTGAVEAQTERRVDDVGSNRLGVGLANRLEGRNFVG